MRNKKIILITVICLILLLLLFIFRHKIMRRLYNMRENFTQQDGSCPDCSNCFNDVVAIQRQAYNDNDIQPQPTFDELYKLE